MVLRLEGTRSPGDCCDSWACVCCVCGLSVPGAMPPLLMDCIVACRGGAAMGMALQFRSESINFNLRACGSGQVEVSMGGLEVWGQQVDAVRRSTTPSGAILRDLTFYAEKQ